LIKIDLEKLSRIIGGVDTAVQDVQGVLGEAGVGGNLNEEQAVRLEHTFAVLAQTALSAFHEAHDIAITPEAIAALLPTVEDTVLPPVAPAPVAPVVDAPAPEVPAADAPAADAPAVDPTENLPEGHTEPTVEPAP
jgi:hypothetical protein